MVWLTKGLGDHEEDGMIEADHCNTLHRHTLETSTVQGRQTHRQTGAEQGREGGREPAYKYILYFPYIPYHWCKLIMPRWWREGGREGQSTVAWRTGLARLPAPHHHQVRGRPLSSQSVGVLSCRLVSLVIFHSYTYVDCIVFTMGSSST